MFEGLHAAELWLIDYMHGYLGCSRELHSVEHPCSEY